jgi:putative transposase
MMKAISGHYAKCYNEGHRRTGVLWQGRYRSTAIDSPRYFFACSRYIELNPVRAGLVVSPAAYQWSSFAQNAGTAPKALVSPHQLYTNLGRTDRARRLAYRELFQTALEDDTIAAIRQVITHSPKPGGRSFQSGRDSWAREILRGSGSELEQSAVGGAWHRAPPLPPHASVGQQMVPGTV